MRLQLRRPFAAAAVFFAAVGIAVITTPPPASAATTPAATTSAAAATTPVATAPAAVVFVASATPLSGATLVDGAADYAAGSGSSPRHGETIKRIRLWQSLTSMGILVGSLVLVKRLALRH